MNKVLHWMVLLLSMLHPLSSLLAAAFGYWFVLADYQSLILIMTLLFIADAVCAFCFRKENPGKVTTIPTVFLPLLVVISWFLSIFQCDMNLLILFCMMINMASASFLAMRYARTEVLFSFSIITAAVLILPVLGCSVFELLVLGML